MRRFVIFGAVIAAVVVIWSAGWLYLANEIRSQVGTLAQNDGYADPKVTCGTTDVAGYPFRFNLTCADATVVTGDVTIALPRIEAASLIFQPTLFHVRATGPATVEDAFLGGKNRVDWTNFEGSLRLADWTRIGRLSVVADNPAWSDTLVTETLIGSATRAEVHLVDLPEKHTAGRATLEGYALLDGAAIPSWTVADGDLTATLEVTALPDNLFALPAEPIRDWQAAGGRITITELKGTDGRDSVTVTGDAGLNADGLAEGTIDVVSNGIAQRAAAFLQPDMATLILGPPDDDGVSRQRLTITSGILFLGMLPAFMVPTFF